MGGADAYYFKFHAIIEKILERSIKTFWKNESNVGLVSQKGWEQGRVVEIVKGILTLEKEWKQGRVVVTVHMNYRVVTFGGSGWIFVYRIQTRT